MNRLTRFYKRFKNQHRIHKHHLSLWVILRIAWIQSKKRPTIDNSRETLKNVVDLSNVDYINKKE